MNSLLHRSLSAKEDMQAPQVQVLGTPTRVFPLSIAYNNLKRYATVALWDDRGSPRV
jgi:hypothetical protein